MPQAIAITIRLREPSPCRRRNGAGGPVTLVNCCDRSHSVARDRIRYIGDQRPGLDSGLGKMACDAGQFAGGNAGSSRSCVWCQVFDRILRAAYSRFLDAFAGGSSAASGCDAIASAVRDHCVSRGRSMDVGDRRIPWLRGCAAVALVTCDPRRQAAVRNADLWSRESHGMAERACG